MRGQAVPAIPQAPAAPAGVLDGLSPQVRRLLGTGAVPVLVKGPTDAVAITLAGAGRYVGTASCGTALTNEHLDFFDDVLSATSMSRDEGKSR